MISYRNSGRVDVNLRTSVTTKTVCVLRPPSANAPLKARRRPSVLSNFHISSTNQVPMSGLRDAAPISGKGERKPEEERSLTSLNFMLPSTSIDTIVSHPSQTPSLASALSSTHVAPAASSLVDGPRRVPGAIPKAITDILKNWLHRHSDHPYPSEDETKQLCAATGLSKNQVSNWVINVGQTYSRHQTVLTCLKARRRIIAPGHRSSRSGIVADPGVQTGIQLGELDETLNSNLNPDDVNV